MAYGQTCNHSLLLQKAAKRGRGAPSRLLYAVAAPLVHGRPENRSRRRAGGSFLDFRRPPAGPRGRQRLEADAAAAPVATARQSWRPGAAAALAVQHTHQQSRHEHRSLTLFTTGPRGLPQVHLERREARQAPGADPSCVQGHREVLAADDEARCAARRLIAPNAHTCLIAYGLAQSAVLRTSMWPMACSCCVCRWAAGRVARA